MAKAKRTTKQTVDDTKKRVTKKTASNKRAAPPKKTIASSPAPKPKAQITPQKRKAPTTEPAPAQKRQRAAVPTLLPVSHHTHGKTPAELFVWGDGGCGQLGMGEDVMEKYRPSLLPLPGGKKVLQVACGGMHTVALAEDGTLYTWGVNDEGALGRETEGELWGKSALATGNVQPSDIPIHVPLPEPIVQVTAGDSHTCALTSLGSVYSWGTFRDASGVMGFAPTTRVQLLPTLVHHAKTPDAQLIQIASGADHVLGLTTKGVVLSWGNGQQGQLGRVGARQSERTKFATLLDPHAVPIRRTRGRRVAHVVEVNAGTYDSFVVLDNGTVLSCGVNNYGQLGLRANAGDMPYYELTPITELQGATHIKGGQHHTLAVDKDGVLVSFGRPTYGRLGRADAPVNEDVAMPVPGRVNGLDGVRVVAMAAGLAVSGCVGEDGSVWAWGFGTNYQLGRGDDDDDATMPVRIPVTKAMQGKRVVSMEFGGQHAALLAV